MHYLYAALSVLALAYGLFRILMTSSTLSEFLLILMISAILAVAAEVSELSAAYQRTNPEPKPDKPSDM